jgi:hypothetical protein
MKRLVAILSVLTALALSSVAAAPASAGSVPYGGVTLSCVDTSGVAKYTLTYKTHSLTFTFGKKCLI